MSLFISVLLIVVNVVTKGECLSVFFQFFGSCLTVFEVCFQLVVECCRQRTVSKEIQHTKLQAEMESKEHENAALISNGNPSSEIQDEEEQEGSEPKEDGFFSRNLKRFLKYQTASQQATGLGYRIHKKVNEGADDDVIDAPLLGTSSPAAASGGEGPNISVKGPKFKRGRGRNPKKLKVRGVKR
ncbi:uncharacterized protein LOC142351659 [Convolutriloba macropyga]|uniref:uncharacterized protein LOC142351659 n=1 Tax=Convolutriloba macropyga TaxID=536237 RepID=UPI003F5205B1